MKRLIKHETHKFDTNMITHKELEVTIKTLEGLTAVNWIAANDYGKLSISYSRLETDEEYKERGDALKLKLKGIQDVLDGNN